MHIALDESPVQIIARYTRCSQAPDGAGGVSSVNGQPETPAIEPGSSGGVLGQDALAGVPLAAGTAGAGLDVRPYISSAGARCVA
jgi:hypothetical protein